MKISSLSTPRRNGQQPNSSDDPLGKATTEARRWMRTQQGSLAPEVEQVIIRLIARGAGERDAQARHAILRELGDIMSLFTEEDGGVLESTALANARCDEEAASYHSRHPASIRHLHLDDDSISRLGEEEGGERYRAGGANAPMSPSSPRPFIRASFSELDFFTRQEKWQRDKERKIAEERARANERAARLSLRDGRYVPTQGTEPSPRASLPPIAAGSPRKGPLARSTSYSSLATGGNPKHSAPAPVSIHASIPHGSAGSASARRSNSAPPSPRGDDDTQRSFGTAAFAPTTTVRAPHAPNTGAVASAGAGTPRRGESSGYGHRRHQLRYQRLKESQQAEKKGGAPTGKRTGQTQQQQQQQPNGASNASRRRGSSATRQRRRSSSAARRRSSKGAHHNGNGNKSNGHHDRETYHSQTDTSEKTDSEEGQVTEAERNFVCGLGKRFGERVGMRGSEGIVGMRDAVVTAVGRDAGTGRPLRHVPREGFGCVVKEALGIDDGERADRIFNALRKDRATGDADLRALLKEVAFLAGTPGPDGSSAAPGPLDDVAVRERLLFDIFDLDGDGMLNEDELSSMFDVLIRGAGVTPGASNLAGPSGEGLVKTLTAMYRSVVNERGTSKMITFSQFQQAFLNNAFLSSHLVPHYRPGSPDASPGSLQRAILEAWHEQTIVDEQKETIARRNREYLKRLGFAFSKNGSNDRQGVLDVARMEARLRSRTGAPTPAGELDVGAFGTNIFPRTCATKGVHFMVGRHPQTAVQRLLFVKFDRSRFSEVEAATWWNIHGPKFVSPGYFDRLDAAFKHRGATGAPGATEADPSDPNASSDGGSDDDFDGQHDHDQGSGSELSFSDDENTGAGTHGMQGMQGMQGFTGIPAQIAARPPAAGAVGGGDRGRKAPPRPQREVSPAGSEKENGVGAQ